MRIGFTKRALSLILAICMVTSAFTVTAFAAGGWSPKTSTKIYVDATAVSQFEALEYEANFFEAEYEEKIGDNINTAIGAVSDAGSEDIILTYDASVPTQGFNVSVSGDKLIVAASDDDGIFYGCRYVIQQLLINGSVSAASQSPSVLERSISLDNGRKYYSVEWIKELIREMSWSNMNTLVMHFSEEMGLGLETKLYPWLNGRDGTLCTQAELETVDNRYLTQKEFLEIAAYAEKYHVDLMPSLDSPGHLNYLVKTFNDKVKTDGSFSFTYNGKTYKTTYSGSTYKFYVDGVSQGSSTYGIGNYFKYNGTTTLVKGSRNANYSRGIDISNPVAVAFVQSLTVEYGNLFRSVGATKIDIGGDELLGWGAAVTSSVAKWKQLDHWKAYAQNRAKAEGKSNYSSAVAYDAFLYYMNDLNDLARSLGYTGVRMWNDDALRSSDTGWNKVVELDQDIDIWFWTIGSNTCWTYATAGYQLYNILSDYTYYAMTSDYFSDERGSFDQAYADQIYNEWSPFVFTNSGNANYIMSTANPNVLGGALGIWSDNPNLRTETQVMADIKPLFRAIGAKSWNATANSSVKYSTYSANLTKMGDAPAIDPSAVDTTVPNPAALRAAVKDAAAIDGSQYTAASYAALENAVAQGNALLTYGAEVQADLTAAVNAIASAKAALVTDTQALTAAVAEAASITEGMYSDASYAAYLEAVKAGRAVLDNADATPAEVSAALEAILTAKSKLTSDKSALKTAVDNAPSLKDVDTTQFTQEVLDRYTAALANAEAVLENSAATQPEVNAALAELLEAKKAIFVDLTALEAAVALAPNVVARKDLIVGAFYNDYMFLVEEAKNEYLSGHINDQNAVDAMTNALMTSYERLMSGQHDKDTVLDGLPELIARHDELAVYNENPMTAFVFEGWLLYHTAVMNAKDLIASDAYDRASVDAAISEIQKTSWSIEYAMVRIPGEVYPNAEGPTITEAMVPRKDMINSAGFQVKSVYSGRTARLSINTIKSFNVQEVIIIGEDGLQVPANITVAPVNPRKPNQKILYADIVLDLEPGTYTFTVYVRETNSQGQIVYNCSKPVTCTITVQ
ncbi:MAG: family 20 glycosylhydrolase [Clostridia bacterium]|nr:family 20 glycosylhydrolase [Clostridia bacterium]